MEILPIKDSDLVPVCDFLHANLPSQITTDNWLAAFRLQWSNNRPNHGFMLIHEDRIVGVVGAFYSQQLLRGKTVDICNIHSWTVLPEYRSDSIYLLIKIIRQPGFHFTILTPRAQEMEIYRFLKFRTIITRMVITANFPWPFARLTGLRSVTDTGKLQQVLKAEDGRIHCDHTALPWLKHIAVGVGDKFCYVIYQCIKLKNLPVAAVLYVSDPELFDRYRLALGHALFLRGLLFMRVESRFQTALPKLSIVQKYPNPTLVLSDLLVDADVKNIYSERTALNLDGVVL
ncbi:MAG: hypothetical protein HQL70_07220 [Magnetococcales bacterium]|nr:hypothetical protein [Magnetococcales bacterium]